MASAADVAKALLDRAETLTFGSPALKKAMPDVAFAPENGKPYFRVDHFPNSPVWEGLAAGVVDQGLLQITVVWPKGAGIIKASAAVDAVKAHFAKGLKLFQGASRVKIGQAWHADALEEAAWTLTPITIPWTAS